MAIMVAGIVGAQNSLMEVVGNIKIHYQGLSDTPCIYIRNWDEDITSAAPPDAHIGVYSGVSSDLSTTAKDVYGLMSITDGDLAISNGSKYGVYAEVTGAANYNYIICSLSAGNCYYGYGVYGYAAGAQTSHGLFGASEGGDINYGVYGDAWGDNSNKYGVYGFAHGSGGDNYAGYFVGDGYFNGNLGIGSDAPVEKLDVDGAAMLKNLSATPVPSSGSSKFFAMDNNGTSRMYVMDGGGTWNPVASHSDPRDIQKNARSSFDDVNVSLPFSFHHANQFIGKGAVVDMAAVVAAVEQLTGATFTYEYNLPANEVLDVSSWARSEHARMVTEAKRNAIINEKEIEIPITEAWEMREAEESVDSTTPVTKFRFDLATESVVSYTVQEKTVVKRVTGATERKLKRGVRFDEETGKFYRRRQISDVPEPTIPEPKLPDWVMARITPKQ